MIFEKKEKAQDWSSAIFVILVVLTSLYSLFGYFLTSQLGFLGTFLLSIGVILLSANHVFNKMHLWKNPENKPSIQERFFQSLIVFFVCSGLLVLTLA